MKYNEGRLQTGEHILAKIIENKIPDARVVIAKFNEDEGLVEMNTQVDLRSQDISIVEDDVNRIIKQSLPVHISIKKREDVESEFNLSKIPGSVKEIRIVEIEGFDKRPCRDPHVNNTNEIGHFRILGTKRVGKDRYRFIFRVE